jgi:ribosomal protein S8
MINNTKNFTKIHYNLNKIFFIHKYKENPHIYLIKQLKFALIKKQTVLYHPIGGSYLISPILECMVKNNYFFGISEMNLYYKIYLKYNLFGNSIISHILGIPKKQFKNNYLSLYDLEKIKGLTYILSVPTKGIITHSDAIFFKKPGHIILKIIP